MSTAIPTIASHFNSAAGYTWVGSAYLLANAAAAPIWAKVSDIWGRKPVLLAAVAVFFLSSLMCAQSISMGMLIAGRAIQGSAAGGLLILVTVCVSDLFSLRFVRFGLSLDGINADSMTDSADCTMVCWNASGPWPAALDHYSEARSRSWFHGAGSGSKSLSRGLCMTGVVYDGSGWRDWTPLHSSYRGLAALQILTDSCYSINLPFSGVTFIILLFFFDVHNPRTSMSEGLKAVDWLGSFAILGVTLMTMLGLDFGGQTFPWSSPKVICLIVFGLLLTVVFYYSEVKVARYPLMPLKMLRQRTQLAALVVGFIHGNMFIAGEYYLPLYFQSVREASPFHSGLLLLPFILAEALTGILVGIIIHRTGRYRELIWLGTTMITLGYGLLIHLDAHSSLGEIIGLQIVAGIGGGLLFEPPMIAIQVHVSQDDTATATAAFSFVRNLATSLGIVIGGVVFQNSMQLREPQFRNAHLPANVTQALSGSGAAANVMIIATLDTESQREVVKEAFAWSLRNMWIFIASIGVCGVIASAFIDMKVLGRHHVETVTGLKKEQPTNNQTAATS